MILGIGQEVTAPDAAVLAWQQTVNRAWDQLHGGLQPASGYGPSGPRPPGNVAQWTFDVLRANGVPANELDAGAVGIIIAHESSGNPDATPVRMVGGGIARGTPRCT
jgi:hypothetical protein